MSPLLKAFSTVKDSDTPLSPNDTLHIYQTLALSFVSLFVCLSVSQDDDLASVCNIVNISGLLSVCIHVYLLAVFLKFY
jgi:hypothetical protein